MHLRPNFKLEVINLLLESDSRFVCSEFKVIGLADKP